MRQTVSIVIPVYNHWPLVHQLLMDIKQHCPVDEVLVVNDGSEDGDVYAGLKFWKILNVIPLKVLNLSENIGFLLAANRGLKEASGDIVILLSDDVRIINKNFITDVLHSVNDGNLVGAKLYIEDTGWNKFGNRVIPYLEGWCLATTKDTWECLGYFDPRYAPSDFEDVDLSYEATLPGVGGFDDGLQLVCIPEGSIKHLGAQTYGYTPEREARTKENRKKFIEKWGLSDV